MSPTWLYSSTLMFMLLFVVQPAAAACGERGRPWVGLTFEGEDWPPQLRDDASADLRAGLLLHGIDLCDADSPAATRPVALLELHVSAAEHVRVSIEVRDAITNKRVLRDVDLHTASPDARGLVLAQAADELLRASWVELEMEDAPPPIMPAPTEVQNVVHKAPAVAPLRPVLGAQFAFEHFAGGQNLLGADAFIDVWILRRLGFSVDLGVRSGLSVSAAHGSIATRAVLVGADVFATLWRASARYNLGALLGVQLADLVVLGHATDAVRADERSAIGVTAHAGIVGLWQITSSLRLSLQVEPGATLRSVAALDSGHDVVSTSGFALQTTLGLGGSL